MVSGTIPDAKLTKSKHEGQFMQSNISRACQAR